MISLDSWLYAVASVLQLAAMVYAIRMARQARDRRPWMTLFAALLIMFVFRLVNLHLSQETRQHVQPFIAIAISLLLSISLFYIQKIATAERTSSAMAERRTVERDESESRYKALVELSPDVMFVHAGGKIAYVNAAAMKFFGAKDSAQLIGHSPLEFVAPQSRAVVEKRIDQLTQLGQVSPVLEEYWVRLDGSSVPVDASAAVVPWHGGKAIHKVLRDISERKRSEEEKARLLADERAARSSAEHASRMKDEFLATLSHELRTPLNAILGWSTVLLRMPRDGEDLDRGLEAIERNTRAQSKLIEDLLDMSRIISGKLRLDIQRLLPITFIEAAMETIRPSAEAKGVRLEQVLDPLAGPISGDPNRLQQVMWNVLSNAVKFTPRGGKVQIVLQRVNSHIEISVADTGEGIEADFLPYVFDRFRQADATTTRRHGGLGLGLALAKQLVDLHGGSIDAKSPGRGMGSTFTTALPLTIAHTAADQTPKRIHPHTQFQPASSHLAIDLSGVKVLVVDDEPDACSLVERLLKEVKADAQIATSAADALLIVESFRPDVLVSDIGMAGVDGYEFLKRVRTLGASRGGKVPAIALTAFARSEDRTRALMAGYSVHVSKPVEPRELIATVASLVGRTGDLSPEH